jgi:hypothetical protein
MRGHVGLLTYGHAVSLRVWWVGPRAVVLACYISNFFLVAIAFWTGALDLVRVSLLRCERLGAVGVEVLRKGAQA